MVKRKEQPKQSRTGTNSKNRKGSKMCMREEKRMFEDTSSDSRYTKKYCEGNSAEM